MCIHIVVFVVLPLPFFSAGTYKLVCLTCNSLHSHWLYRSLQVTRWPTSGFWVDGYIYVTPFKRNIADVDTLTIFIGSFSFHSTAMTVMANDLQ